MKKLFASILALVMILSVAMIPVSAAEIPADACAVEITVDFVNCNPGDSITLTLRDLSWAGDYWGAYAGQTLTFTADNAVQDVMVPKKDISWAFGADFAQNYWVLEAPEGYTVTPEFIDGDGNDPATKGHAKFTVTGTGASAAAPEILKGTPTVDGKLDEIYKQSYKATVDTSAPIWVPKASDDKVSTDVYFLHDGTYLYVAAVVTGDSAVVDTGLNTWVADSVEIWFRAEELHDGKVKYSKVPMGAFGNPLPNGAIGTWDNLMDLKLEDAVLAATQTEGGYTVEMKLAIPYYNAEQNSIAINVQLNNVYDADANADNIGSKNGGFYGSQASNSDPTILALSADAVTVPDSSNPKDGDAISVFVALLAVSAMGIAIVSKKKF